MNFLLQEECGSVLANHSETAVRQLVMQTFLVLYRTCVLAQIYVLIVAGSLAAASENPTNIYFRCSFYF